jgi:transposase-like protein
MVKRNGNKEREWRGWVEKQRRSGQAVRAFCREQGLNEATLYRWRREIERRDREGEVTRSGVTALAPVVVIEELGEDAKSSETLAAIEIVLHGGTVVRVSNNSTREQLGVVLDVLERSRC